MEEVLFKGVFRASESAEFFIFAPFYFLGLYWRSTTITTTTTTQASSPICMHVVQCYSRIPKGIVTYVPYMYTYELTQKRVCLIMRHTCFRRNKLNWPIFIFFKMVKIYDANVELVHKSEPWLISSWYFCLWCVCIYVSIYSFYTVIK